MPSLTHSKSKYQVNKTTVEWIALMFLFVASFFHSLTLLFFMILLLFLLKQKEIGAIKIIMILAFRTFMNPGIAVDAFYFGGD